MTVQRVSILPPPRISGNPKQDAQIFSEYSYSLYKSLVLEGRVISRLNALAAVEPLSGSATLTDVINKINEIIQSAG